jgi:VanZ family protein
MGKREVRVIRVPKWASAVLLVLVSAAMLAMLFYLSGKAYANGREPLRNLALRVMQRGPVTRNAVLASIMPAIANMLFFLPWGFLLFLTIDAPPRNRVRSYLITIIAGTLFAIGMQVWQTWLPTRVLAPPDTLAQGVGAFAGAIAGHLRKRVRVQFDY